MRETPEALTHQSLPAPHLAAALESAASPCEPGAVRV